MVTCSYVLKFNPKNWCSDHLVVHYDICHCLRNHVWVNEKCWQKHPFVRMAIETRRRRTHVSSISDMCVQQFGEHGGQWLQKLCLPEQLWLGSSSSLSRTHRITSTRFSYVVLLRLRRSMRLTEMYGHTVQQNEQPRSKFFIITHNDYELNFGGKKSCKSISACSSASSGNESIRWWMGVIHAFSFYTSC